MSQRKIGTLPLCAMMTGSVLGSGIIILPPLVLDIAGGWAIVGWGAILLFSLAFAYVFATVGALFPGEGGAASAVERAFGPAAKRLASAALSGAVLFGPAAVMMTIAEYLPPAVMPASEAGRALVPAFITLICSGLVISGLKNMSRFAMALAATATILLLAGSGAVLISGTVEPAPLPPFDGPQFGYAMLLLFWAVVGWEVVGNYGNEVIDPRRTMPRAAMIAAAIIGLVSMGVAAALQYGDLPPGGRGVTVLLVPLFGSLAPWGMAALTLCLCTTTYLVIIGAISRLVAHLAQESGLPNVLDRRNRHGVPWVVVTIYTVVHLCQFLLAGFGVIDLAGLVAVSDGFFLANALLGTLAAVRLFTRPLHKGVAAALSLGVFAVLTQSHWQVLAALAVMAVFTWLQPAKPARSAT